VEISDTRGPGKTWKLIVEAKEQLTSPEGHILAPLILTTADGNQTVLTQGVSSVVAEATTGSEADQTVNWQSGKGFSLNVPAGSYAGEYQGEVEWQLQDAP